MDQTMKPKNTLVIRRPSGRRAFFQVVAIIGTLGLSVMASSIHLIFESPLAASPMRMVKQEQATIQSLHFSEIAKEESTPIQEKPNPIADKTASDIRSITGTISKGDTIASLLRDYIPMNTIVELSMKSQSIYPFTRIMTGHIYSIYLNKNEFYSFEYGINKNDRLVIRKQNQGFVIAKEPIVYELKTEVVSASIRSSLINAIEDAGETAELGVRIAEIFAWDIDFINDVRPGDRLQAVVEKRFYNGKPVGYDKISAVYFTNGDKLFKAFLFNDSDHLDVYYDEKGNSLRKAFLKAPLDFTRISSGYTHKRLHPILKTYLPHNGIDYAAPTGTPIKAIGNGIVVEKGFDKAAGRFIKIRHNNGYETSYCHMSHFNKEISKGKRVYQGQVIGYVGSTGYATGPHLDFRMKKNGRYINPLKEKLPSTEPVQPENLPIFLARVQSLDETLQNVADEEEILIAKLIENNDQ